MKDGTYLPSFMSNKDNSIIILYARIRHVQFKWRSCQQGWWRTIDPSTILYNTDVKDGIIPPSFMSNKNVIIIILYTRMRHVQFKWRSCRWGWWRTIDPSTLLDKTDVKDGINLPSFMPITNIIYRMSGWVDGCVGGGEERWHEGWYISTAIHVKRKDFYGAGSCPCIMY